MGRHAPRRREEIRRTRANPGEHLGCRVLFWRISGPLGRFPLTDDAGTSTHTGAVLSRRTAQRVSDSSVQQYSAPPVSRLLCGRDGPADIWTDVPDVLGSIANYLQKSGWQSGLTWGFEVIVPQGFDYQTSRG